VALRPVTAQPIIISTTYLGTGYDLSVGNPEGEDLFNGGLDPGLRPTSQILVVSSNNNEKDGCPLEATCTRLDMNIVHKDLVDDMLKYQQEIQRNWILEEDEALKEEASSTPFSAGSHVTEQVRDIVEKNGDVITTIQNWEVHAEASYNYRSHRKLNPEFVLDVCSLPDEFNNETRTVYFRFLQTWGTHVLVHVRLGRKAIERASYAQKDYLMHLVKRNDLNLVNTTMDKTSRQKFLSASSELTTPYTTEIAQGLSNVQPILRSKSEVGSQNAPIPLYSHLEDLSFFISSSYIDESEAVNICPNLEKLREPLEESIREYLKPSIEQRAAQPMERTLKMSLASTNVWPSGSYAYLRPQSGCPAGFESGTRKHDLEDNSSGTAFSSGLSSVMAGTFEQDVSLEFCVKTFPTPSDAEWSLGSYCVMKKDNCPPGFTVAEAFLDDEDSDNRNKQEGILPDGIFGRDTRYQFCCRNDGVASNAISLPTKEPFVLFPENTSKTCQKVEGMESVAHWITFDTEGSSSDVTGSGALPYFEKLSSGNIQMFLCYYTKH
jgi:hypothetical protein